MPVTRLAHAGDVGVLREIAQAAFQRYTPRIGVPPFPMTADYAALVAQGSTWVAEADGEVVGLLVLLDETDHLLVEILAVAPGSQGHGVGAELLRLAEQQAAARGYRELRLYTNEAMTENLVYYPRRGYLETHRSTMNGFHRVHFSKRLDAGPDP